MHTRDFVVPFEELFDKIIDHETFLLHNKKQNNESLPPIANLAKHSTPSYHSSKPNLPSPAPSLLPIPLSTSKHIKPHVCPPINNPVICQIYNKCGHATNRCFKLFPHLHTQHPFANYVVFSPIQNPWIVDLGASHHLLIGAIYFHINPMKAPMTYIGDNLGLKITHISFVFLFFFFSHFFEFIHCSLCLFN